MSQDRIYDYAAEIADAQAAADLAPHADHLPTQPWWIDHCPVCRAEAAKDTQTP